MKQAILPYALVFCLFPRKDPARRMNRKGKDHLAFRNKADWVWGESKKGNAYLAALVAKTMFEEFTP